MWRYILRRLMWVIVVLLVITLITFVIFFVMPSVDPASRSAIKPELFSRFLITAQLAVGAALVWLSIGIPIGVASAVRRRSLLDRAAMAFALFFVSMPVFLLGLLALWLLWFKWHLTPGTGYISVGTNFGSWLGHMILPWFVLAMLFAAFYARMTRGNLIETMAQDYIRTARVKGLPEWKVILKHGLRASLTPVVTMFGMDLGSLFGTAVVTESVFNLQGMGQWAIISVFAGDIPTVLAVVSVTAVAIALCNLIVDVLYAYLDPRVRYS